MKTYTATLLISILSFCTLAQEQKIRSDIKLTDPEPRKLEPINHDMPLHSSGDWTRSNYKEGLLDHLENELAKVISENWFIETKETSIVLTYCRSCQQIYEKHEDSLNKSYYAWRDSVRAVIQDKPHAIRGHELWPAPVWREDLFKKYGPDSVSFFSPLGSGYMTTTEEARLANKPEGILQIEIQFDDVWSEKKIQRIQYRNDSLKMEILKTPLYKTITSFDDYRAYLPQAYLKRRTQRFDYYFERLPYRSDKCKYSIFLLGNKEELCTETILVDRNDPLYFQKQENHIEKERRATIILVAYILGLEKFEYIGQ